MKIPHTIEKRVEAGVAFLNVVKPNWLKKIDVEKLDLIDKKVCMLGELYGNYDDGLSQLGLKNGTSATNLGFYGSERGYKVLTEVWKRKIIELRGE